METGLMYYDARYYNPELKRFTSVDPPLINLNKDIQNLRLINPQDLNGVYTYTLNNPMKYVDPSGEDTYSIEAEVDATGLSGVVGVEVDFDSGQLNVLYGAGVSTGVSGAVTLGYSPEDLTGIDYYLTQEANVQGGYYVAGKASVSNTISPLEMSVFDFDAELSPALGAGGGFSASYSAVNHVNIIDAQEAKNWAVDAYTGTKNVSVKAYEGTSNWMSESRESLDYYFGI